VTLTLLGDSPGFLRFLATLFFHPKKGAHMDSTMPVLASVFALLVTVIALIREVRLRRALQRLLLRLLNLWRNRHAADD